MWESKNAGSALVWKESQSPARALGLQLHSMQVNSADEFEGAFRAAIQARTEAILVTPMILATSNRSMLVRMAAAARLPAIYSRSEFVESDGLMSDGAEQNDAYLRLAAFVDKILKGTKPADLPVEQPTRFEMVINGKTAKALGLKIPHALLISADTIIE